ncbi:uncharacterized protein LOC119992537 [Tripterygium wilfordii]|nr:uncharacterized protein LOC119992537 [Tripterygium wilfordii]
MAQHKDQPSPNQKRNRCLIVTGAVLLLLLLLLSIIALILALTIFKPKQPQIHVISANVDGIAPRFSFPLMNIELNLTINLEILVENPNHASFKHGAGKSFLLYKGNQVGEADLYPGLIPSRGSETLPCRLTIKVDSMTSNAMGLISEAVAGHVGMETHTRIPGTVTFLGIFKKHAVAASECQFSISFPSMKIGNQQCNSTTKF